MSAAPAPATAYIKLLKFTLRWSVIIGWPLLLTYVKLSTSKKKDSSQHHY